jgi:uncharacterized repeat protein (TIGR01451 family)/MYXO-CTERM domain-containing protein
VKSCKPVVVALLVALSLSLARPALATTTVNFNSGSLIIPMDTDYQDAGMLTAFGLLDKLLRAGVTVNWVIDPNKVCTVTSMTMNNTSYTCTPNDLTASATDFKTPTTIITNHGYRGGPFVIDSTLASQASPIIKAWQAANTSVNTFTTVHVATAPFTAPVSRVLTAAPRIAVLNDGNQQIAFGYLNAALILDEKGLAWGNTSVDLLADTAVSGGALFEPSGQPAFCEIMTMHWNVGSTDIPGVTAQMAKFLQFPVHVNAECQAVNAVEGDPNSDGGTGGNQDFVTTAGFQWPAPAQPTYVQFSNSALPFAQIDGPFQTTGGSEPAYALATGSAYYNQDIVMMRAAGVGFGVQDLWMTGYAKGACDIDQEGCNGIGKVSYLGGHQYQSQTPMTKNPMSQGSRLFLNSLYEAGCVTSEGQPSISLQKTAPSAVSSADVTFTITYSNFGAGPAINVILTDPIPVGSSFVSATNGGTFAGGVVTWQLGDLGKNTSDLVSVTVALAAKGTYTNQAAATFHVGLNTQSAQSNQTSTIWGQCAVDGDCTAPQVCDITTSMCVQCTASEQQNCADAGSGVCQPNDTCAPAVIDAGSDAGSSNDAGAADASGSSSGGGDATVGDASGSGSGSGGGDATVADGSGSGSSGSSGSSGGSSSGSTSGSGSGAGSSSGSSGGDDASASNEGATSGESSGCGCTVPGTQPGPVGGIASAVFALLVAARRRRKQGR